MENLDEWSCLGYGMRSKIKFCLFKASTPYYLYNIEEQNKIITVNLYNSFYGYIHQRKQIAACFNKEKYQYIYEINLPELNDDKYWRHENFLTISFQEEVNSDRVTLAGNLIDSTMKNVLQK